MAEKTLFFRGDQVGYFDSVNDAASINGSEATEFAIVGAFDPDDIIEVVITDINDTPDFDANGEFADDELIISSITLIRDGERFEFPVKDDGAKINPSDGSAKEQGDTFFTTADAIGTPPPPDGVSNLPFIEEKMVFTTDPIAVFETGQSTVIQRVQDQDFDDNNIIGVANPAEEGNGIFNIEIAQRPICLAPWTLIATETGEVPIEDLRPGDQVMTMDDGLQPVLWAGRMQGELQADCDRDRPVLCKQGALGEGLPRRDLVMSPLHHVLMEDDEREDGPTEVLAVAKGLVSLPGWRYMRGKRSFDYVTILLPRHSIIFAEGVPTESLYPGITALRMISPRERQELLETLRDANLGVGSDYGPTARHRLTKRESARLAATQRRHVRAKVRA